MLHSERYSKNSKPTKEFIKTKYKNTIRLVYYEKPFKTNLRRLFSGQSWKKCNIDYDVSYSHHQTHASCAVIILHLLMIVILLSMTALVNGTQYQYGTT